MKILNALLMIFFGYWRGKKITMTLGYALGVRKNQQPKLSSKKGLLPMALLLGALTSLAGCQYHARNDWLISSDEKNSEAITEKDERGAYRIFSEYSTAHIALRGEPTLKIENDFPRLDGATALFPVYASAAQVIYKKPEDKDETSQVRKMVDCSRTPAAYDALIDGKADLIFVAAPSEKQLGKAKEMGLTLNLIPMGKEAFVFLVNQQNPVKGLTAEQIQNIYSGKVSNWKEVGGSDMPIRAFQRPEGSGSQSTMVNKVMKRSPLKEP